MKDLHMETEFLVVGAGAAGCTLSWLLHQAGRNVLMLELHDKALKDKLCGGILSKKALLEIEMIFGEGALLELAPTRPTRFRSWCLGWEVIVDGPFATLPRKRLDDWLLARCENAGVRVLDRMRILSVEEQSHVVTCEDLRDGSTMRVSYGTLIGADGASSAVRRLLTGREQRCAASVGGVAPLVTGDVVFEYHPSLSGYCWYVPTGESANVGCGLYGSSAADCRKLLADFCEELGISLSQLRGAPVPTGDDVLLRAGDDVWLVGDSAGLVRPIAGSGIFLALKSSHVLASSLLGGAPYEEVMNPVADELALLASEKDVIYLSAALAIAKEGQRIMPLTP